MPTITPNIPPTPLPSDRDLLDAWVRQSDRQAIAELLMRWHASCLRVAQRLAVGEAEDAVQDGFMAAMGAAAGCRGEPGPWLIAVVANAARKRLRSEHRIQARAREAEAARAEPFARGLPDSDLAAVVRAALGDVPEHERLPLLMRYADGMQPMLIAKALGISRVAVRMRLHRGLKRLRGLLERRGLGAATLGGWALLVAPQAPSAEELERTQASASQGPVAGPTPAVLGWPVLAAFGALALIVAAVALAPSPRGEEGPAAVVAAAAVHASPTAGETMALRLPFRFNGDTMGTALGEIARRLPDEAPLSFAIAEGMDPSGGRDAPGADAWGLWTWRPPAGSCRVDEVLDQLTAAFGLRWELAGDTVVLYEPITDRQREESLARIATLPADQSGNLPPVSNYTVGHHEVLFPCRLWAEPADEDLRAGMDEPQVWAAAALAALAPGAGPRARRLRHAFFDRALPKHRPEYFLELHRHGDPVMRVLIRHPEVAAAARACLARAAAGQSGLHQVLVALRIVGADPRPGDAALVVGAAEHWRPWEGPDPRDLDRDLRLQVSALIEVAAAVCARCADPVATPWLIRMVQRSRGVSWDWLAPPPSSEPGAVAVASGPAQAETDDTYFEWLQIQERYPYSALGRCWSPAAWDLLQSLVPDRRKATRWTARTFPPLAGNGDPAVAAALRDAQSSQDPWVRAAAAITLARSQDAGGVAACCSLASEGSLPAPDRLRLVAEAARSASPGDLPLVIDALRRVCGPLDAAPQNITYRGNRLSELRFAAGMPVGDRLLALLDDPAASTALVAVVAQAVAVLRDDGCDAALLARWRLTEGVRARIIGQALLATADPVVARELRAGLGLPEPFASPQAMLADGVARSTPANVLPTLSSALAGRQAVEFLREMADDPGRPAWFRGGAWLTVIGRSDDPLGDARRAGQDPDGYVRACALHGLAQRLPRRGTVRDQALAHVLERLTDPDPRVRTYAAFALTGVREAPQAVEPHLVRQLSEDPSPLARRAAAIALCASAWSGETAGRSLRSAAIENDDAGIRELCARLSRAGTLTLTTANGLGGGSQSASARSSGGLPVDIRIDPPQWTEDPEDMPSPTVGN